jgi:secreted trypsin-like serine protease
MGLQRSIIPVSLWLSLSWLLFSPIAVTAQNGEASLRGLKDEPLVATPKIIGGEDAIYGRFTYSVSLRNNFGKRSHFCGASLIGKQASITLTLVFCLPSLQQLTSFALLDFTSAPDLVLTAAHCQLESDTLVEVVLEPYSSIEDKASKQVFQPKEFRRHPDYYHPVPFANDFQLISLKGVTSKTPIVLQTNTTESELLDGQNLTVFGFGTTAFGTSTVPDVLQVVSSTAINNTACQEAYAPSPFGITSDMLCMVNDGSCNGDSGGPLIIEGIGPFTDVQVGIVSWGIGCDNEVYPGKLRHQHQCCTYGECYDLIPPCF